MLNHTLLPFVSLLLDVIFLVNLALSAWIIVGLLIHFDIINRTNPIVARFYGTLGRLLDPILSRIHRVFGKYLPDLGGIDLAPVILWLLLRFLRSALLSWFFIEPLMVTSVVK